MLIVVPAAIGYGLPVTWLLYVMKKESWFSKAVAETRIGKVANKAIHSPKKEIDCLHSNGKSWLHLAPFRIQLEYLPKGVPFLKGPNQPKNPAHNGDPSIHPLQGTCTKEIVVERSEEVGWCNRRLPKKDLRTVWSPMSSMSSACGIRCIQRVFSNSQEGSSC